MDELEKLLRQAQKKDRERLLRALAALRQGKLDGLEIKKLTNSLLYRVRTGDFRITFSMNGKTIEIESVQRRNEATYKF